MNLKYGYILSVITIFSVLVFPSYSAKLNISILGEEIPGAEKTVMVSLDSEESISAFQLSIQDLGNYVTVLDNSASSIGSASSHSAQAGINGESAVTLMLYSTSMETIPAGTGDIAMFKLKLADTPVDKILPITVKATDENGNPVQCSANPLRFRILTPRMGFPSGVAYDFGRVPIKDCYTITVPIENRGTSPLIIDNIDLSHEKLSVNTALPATINPNSVENIEICFSPEERGQINATATIISNCGDNSGNQILRILASPFAVNEINLENISGQSDETVEVPILLKNMDEITGFTIELNLGKELSYVEGSFKLSNRGSDHVPVATIKDGILLLMAYSLSNSPFAGNDGVIGSFKVRIDGGNYTSHIDVAKAVLPAIYDDILQNVVSASNGCNVSISYPSISVNSSLQLGRTPIIEPTSANLSIFNYGSAPLKIEKVEINGIEMRCSEHNFPIEIPRYTSYQLPFTIDSEIKGILSGNINIYSNDPNARLVKVEAHGERYIPNELNVTASGDTPSSDCCHLNFELSNFDDIYALQFDIEYPDEFTPGNCKFSPRTEDFNCEVRNIGNNTLRLFCFSLSNSPILSGNGPIAEIPFNFSTALPYGDYGFTVKNIVLSDFDMNNVHSGITPYSAVFSYNKETAVNTFEFEEWQESDSTHMHGAYSEPLYFTIDGKVVKHPSTGIYVKKDSNGTSLILIR